MDEARGQRKKEGFQGQKAIVMPRKIIAEQCEKNSIIAGLHITDIGYYPKAKFHYRERQHGSDQHILIYCIEGKGWVELKRSHLTIQAGDFCVIPRNTAHTYASDEKDPWTIYWIHFKGNVSDEIVAMILKQPGMHRGYVNYDEARIDLFSNMYAQLERGYSSDNLVYVNMILWHYLNTFLFPDKFISGHKQNNTDVIDTAIDFMSKKIDQVINLEEIAQTINLSPSHFSSMFKKKTGFSPIEYFNHLKAQKACQYLLFSDLRVKEIAYRLGFDDPYYFSRLFTKIMGVSPVKYKERIVIENKRQHG